jgi:hypothetical protein
MGSKLNGVAFFSLPVFGMHLFTVKSLHETAAKITKFEETTQE